MDHRGTSDFPGFVVTLVKEEELKEQQQRQQHQQGQQTEGCVSTQMTEENSIFLPECIGNVYLVPQEEARALIGTSAINKDTIVVCIAVSCVIYHTACLSLTGLAAAWST
jgi:hypothetical protein